MWESGYGRGVITLIAIDGIFFFSSRRRHTRYWRDWSSDVCSSDLEFVTTNYDPLVELAASDIGRSVRVLPFEEAAPGSPWLLKLHGDAAHPESVVLTREEYLQFGDSRAALAGVLHSLLLTRHVLFVGTSMLDDDLIRIAHQVRSALQLQGSEVGRRTGTVLALREDVARARLWERDVETVAMGEIGRAHV